MPNLGENKNKFGKHPVYLQMDHDLYTAITNYAKGIGLPRSRVIFTILRNFLGPIADEGFDGGD